MTTALKDVEQQNGELLSVCIPTFNRAPYLGALLRSFGDQIEAQPLLANQIVIYISDNSSTDDTPNVVSRAKQRIPQLVYKRNSVNMGGDANILYVRTLAHGYYTWVLGDDEILHAQALVSIIQILTHRTFGLIILYDLHYNALIERPVCFPNYREFARTCVKENPHALVEHSLISSNIYRSDCFDFDVAGEFKDKFYPHMYGMIRPLVVKRLAVMVPAVPVIEVRVFDRPYSPEGGHPPVDEAWKTYLIWLKKELSIPELDPAAPSAWARRAMIDTMIRNPFRFIWRNRRAVIEPSAYRHFFARLFKSKKML